MNYIEEVTSIKYQSTIVVKSYPDPSSKSFKSPFEIYSVVIGGRGDV